MHNLKIPPQTARWIKEFLSNRTFFVQVNGKNSNNKSIKAGVPQGSILYPILFLIYINDIPTSTKNYNKNDSLLFADDLFSFYFDKNLNRIQIIMQKYLNNLEDWLKRWRLKTSGTKCSYNIYQKNQINKKELNLKLFGENIIRDKNPKYLGVILDSNMNLSSYV